jgi:uncharacterized protein YbbC (DUF1343 family)
LNINCKCQNHKQGRKMMSAKPIKLGCEVLLEKPPAWLRTARIGLLINQASVTHSLELASSLILKAGARLTCLFSPQHGFNSEKQANMCESEDESERSLSLPIYSLYGRARRPTTEMLEQIDILLIDLQDVGTRVYTYGTTMGLCLEACGPAGIKVVVLDRPNPINGNYAEGNILRHDHRSFVGRYPIPMRHGLTLGELARYITGKCGVRCDLEVIRMEGWARSDFLSDTDLPWVFPSPNMPSLETALLYPGMVLLEGTNVSEGRGTTLPFQLFGAPFMDQERVLRFLNTCDLEGLVFRPVRFEPVFDKWQGETCHGFQIHITDRNRVRPFRLGLAVLQAFYRLHPDHFAWLPPPYEYEWDKLPIDILLGDGTLRAPIEMGESVQTLEARWIRELDRYYEERREILLYPE